MTDMNQKKSEREDKKTAADFSSRTVTSSRIWSIGTLSYTAGGLLVLFCWLLGGDFAWALKERAVSPMSQLLLKRFEASDLLIGLFTGTLPQAIVLIIQPVISYRSDRYRSRMGRRIPFLILTTPIVFVGTVGLAFSAHLGQLLHNLLGISSPGVNPLCLIFFVIFWIVFEVGTFAANILFLGLINDVVPQVWLGRFFGLFRALSLLAGILFSYYLLGHAEAHFVPMFLGVGLIYCVGFALMCSRVKEGGYPPPQKDGAMQVSKSFISGARTYFRECFSRPYYVLVFIAYNICVVAAIPINLFCIFYAKSIGMSMGTYGKLSALSFSVSFVTSYLMGSLADRFHPLRMAMVTSIIYAVCMIYGGLTINSVNSFSIMFVAHIVLAGAFGTSTAAIGQKLFPRERFTQFYSALMIVQSISIMLVSAGMGAILDFTHHNYRYTFLASGILAGIGTLFIILFVHRQFMALGGPNNYKAP